MSKIQINRGTGYVDRLRAYKIELDGSLLGEIHPEQSVVLDIPPGMHRIRLKIDWCSSNCIDFKIAPDEIVEFDCGNKTSLGLILLYITIFRNKYLWLQRRIESIGLAPNNSLNRSGNSAALIRKIG